MNDMTSTFRKVEHYHDLLQSLRRGIKDEVHVAGGAVRDTILGRPIKDVDVFLADVHGDIAATLLRSEHGYVKVGEWRQYEMFSDPIVARVAKFEKADETIPVCLIGLKEDLSVQENISRFDFGLCMVAWGGDELISSDAFKRDVESKSFTLYRADNATQFAYSMSRFAKLTAERYKNWTLSVPGQFENLAKEHAFRTYWYKANGSHFGIEHNQLLHPKER